MTMLMFQATIIGVTWDLRMKGLDIETFVQTGDRGLVFGGQDGKAQLIPDAFRMTIGYSAALVTIGSLLFGIAWSYRQHGPPAGPFSLAIAGGRGCSVDLGSARDVVGGH